ncbi:PRC-barrel domain-containing protein [Ruminiclostridium herbifermentans]|uniref:PRC-barrel domain-containing protein n=1 Tax=Ruminiclostridium herbifermentans TaxID=2488810 RepID=A0A4U7JBX6_9FIRM|nr:PRC-barrel domain-containing protein [Ruminiclostridium herbifermentans]QNU68018.1 PRC-barrel domain-containing protein [Ruminiclostridium herbifermentans]
MKKSKEIIGLPIISISDGTEVGKVKTVIINAEKGAIDYVVVDSGIQILSAKVIPTEYVLGIGEYALTIENEDAINDISKIPAAIDLLQKNIQVKGTKVLTKKGRLIGEIGDIYVNEDDHCSIIGLEFIADITQKNVRIIPRDSIITFGKNLVVVKDDVETTLLNSAAQINNSAEQADIEKKNLEPNLNQANDSINNTVNSTATEEIDSGAVSDMMEMKHKEYLNGKIATKTIYDDDGSVLIEENTVIDDEIFEIAKAYGKVIELVMNNR